ncbi:transposable element Tcb1 transposase [Trichonephila clavipes]|nr:transposable element Tcb1 transposase [Trichonephila clavipes]
MRICDRWMQQGRTDQRGRSYPHQCTTSREDRKIVRMAVTERSDTSRTIAQHIESVTHHSMSARTIRRRLQQRGLSARRPLLGLPLTQNHIRLRHEWCDERRMWVAEWKEVVFTDESRICLQHHDGRIRVWRHRGERMLNSYVMHRHSGSAPGTMVWGGIRYPSRTPLERIVGTLNSQRYISEVLELVVLPYPFSYTLVIVTYYPRHPVVSCNLHILQDVCDNSTQKRYYYKKLQVLPKLEKNIKDLDAQEKRNEEKVIDDFISIMDSL